MLKSKQGQFCLVVVYILGTTTKLILMEMMTGLVGWGIVHREGYWEGHSKLGSHRNL